MDDDFNNINKYVITQTETKNYLTLVAIALSPLIKNRDGNCN